VVGDDNINMDLRRYRCDNERWI